MAKNEVIGDFKIKEKSEDNLMAQCHQWLWNTYPEHRYKFWHVANERKISLMEGAKLKAKGVLAGVPDYVVNFRGQAFYIEFKKNRGVYSTAQTTVIAALRREHIGVFDCRSFETFKEIIGYIYGEPKSTREPE